MISTICLKSYDRSYEREELDYTAFAMQQRWTEAESRLTLLTRFESTSSFTLGCRKNKCSDHSHVKEKRKQRDAFANSSLVLAVNSFGKDIDGPVLFSSKTTGVVPDRIMKTDSKWLIPQIYWNI